MTNDEVIKLAREAWGRDEDIWLTHEQHFLERFAALVAAAEREACAALVEPNTSNESAYQRGYLDGMAKMQSKPEPVQEPVAWMESPHGAIRANPDYKFAFPSQLLEWKIPLYTCPPKGEQTVPSDCADSHHPTR